MSRWARGVALAAAVWFAGAAASHAAGAMAVGVCAAYGYTFDFADADRAQTTALSK